jgi:hypothetical protein
MFTILNKARTVLVEEAYTLARPIYELPTRNVHVACLLMLEMLEMDLEC